MERQLAERARARKAARTIERESERAREPRAGGQNTGEKQCLCRCPKAKGKALSQRRKSVISQVGYQRPAARGEERGVRMHSVQYLKPVKGRGKGGERAGKGSEKAVKGQ